MRQSHIFSLELICEMTRELKKQGVTVGFTHGAFDLFHTSHLDLLQKASKKCDLLIVGIESDDRVEGYKEYGRPIIPEKERMKLVNQTSCVDVAFIIRDLPLTSQGARELYGEIKPDFIAIGQSYAVEKRVRGDAFSSGASLVKINTVQDQTTTKIINRIIDTYKKKYSRSHDSEIDSESGTP